MDGILIYRSLSGEEVQQAVSSHSKGAKLFFEPTIHVHDRLRNLMSGTIQLPEESKDQISRKLIEEFLAFGDLEILGKTCKEHLALDHTSIWYYHKYRIFLEMRSQQYKIAEINMHLEKFDRLFVYTSNVKDFPLPDNVQIITGPSQKKLNKASIIKYAFLVCLRAWKGWFQSRKITSGQKHIIISKPKTESVYMSRQTLEREQDDFILGYLMQSVDSTFLFLDDLAPPKFASPLTFEINPRHKTNRKNRTQLNTDYALLRALFSIGVLRNVIKTQKSLKRTYDKLAQNISKDPYGQILKRLKRLHGTSIYLAFKYYAMKNFFYKHRFNTITTQDENNTSTKVILDAAKSNDITTIGIQHGAISKLHMGYRFTKSDRDFGGMSDYTLVWGEYWKSVLVEYGNYDPERIVCTGQIRTDIIQYLTGGKVNKAQSDVASPNVVLFATQPQPDAGLRRRAAEDSFLAIREMTDVSLILKLHPGERDPEFYHEIAKSLDVTNYHIDENSDLYALISTCDIVLTCYSTVGGESVYFDKPLIILDHLKQDYCGYYREGVAFQATNSDELRKFIQDILSKELIFDNTAYEKFKSRYAYQIDGKVVERCLKFIKGVA